MDKGLNNFSYKLFFKNYKKKTQQSPDKWPKDHITVQEKKLFICKNVTMSAFIHKRYYNLKLKEIPVFHPSHSER